MNTTRKADLQRKLAMMEVPKPPAGLAERIKNDIPADLGAASSRGTRRGGFAMRIAASLIIVVSGVYLGTRILAPNPAQVVSGMVDRAAGPAMKNVAAPAEQTSDLAVGQQATTAGPVEVEARSNAQPAGRPAAPAIADAKRASESPAADHLTRKDQANEPQPEIAYAPPPPAATHEPLLIAPQASRDAAAAPPAAPAPAAAPEVKTAQRAQQITREEAATAARVASAERDAAVSEVVGGVLSPTAKSRSEATAALADKPVSGGAVARSRFGISTDPLVVERIREALERGERPENVNVEALVNYFAGGAEETVSDLSINLEGSPAPVTVNPSERLVRVSIDAPVSEGLKAKQVASNVQLTVKFDPRVVASYRLIGDSQLSTTPELALFENTSVTALFDIVLKPGVRNRQQVVRVEVEYRDPSGRSRTLTHALKLNEFRQVWPDASRRHRLASLGAIWGQTLKYDTSGTDVAKRAEELARQEPRDTKARELAQLATASSRLRSSGPTGSGR